MCLWELPAYREHRRKALPTHPEPPPSSILDPSGISGTTWQGRGGDMEGGQGCLVVLETLVGGAGGGRGGGAGGAARGQKGVRACACV